MGYEDVKWIQLTQSNLRCRSSTMTVIKFALYFGSYWINCKNMNFWRKTMQWN
jgi:hypothetical protein